MTPKEIGKSCYSNMRLLTEVATHTHAKTVADPCSVPLAPPHTHTHKQAHKSTQPHKQHQASHFLFGDGNKEEMTTINSDFTSYKTQ